MKKIIAMVAVVACMAIGLVGFSGTTAQAKKCPYTGCVDTDTNAQTPNRIKRGNRARVFIRVKTNGNRTPRGKVRIRVKRVGGGFYRQTVRQYRGARPAGWYQGARINRPGRYRITVIYVPGKNQPFNSSRHSTIMRVTR